MPETQPPIELMRQWLDQGGWYEHHKDNKGFKELQDLTFYCAMALPRGGQNLLSPRFIRHFHVVTITPFDDTTMAKIFGTLSTWILSKDGWQPWARILSSTLVDATILLFRTICKELRPMPEKSHYVFNLRDVSKVFQGMGMAAPERVKDDLALQRLWVHECTRVFADRLVSAQDQQWFDETLNATMLKVLRRSYAVVVPTGRLLFANFLELDGDNGVYAEVTEMAEIVQSVAEHLQVYNQLNQKRLDLVLFGFIIQHLTRLTRVLAQPFSNALLIGIGGTGRQSISRLAAHICDIRLFTITLSKAYNREAWREDMRSVVKQTGSQGQSVMLLLTDAQIKEECFLEDLSSLLNTGEIPGLFSNDDMEVYTQPPGTP